MRSSAKNTPSLVPSKYVNMVRIVISGKRVQLSLSAPRRRIGGVEV